MKCSFCHAPLGDLKYFCRPCWFDLPAKERVSLHAMHDRRQEVDSKVAKCVRILTEKAASQTVQ